MSVTFPLDAVEAPYLSDSDVEARQDTSIVFLTALMWTHSSVWTATQEAAEAGVAATFDTLNPLNDYEMVEWTRTYDRMLEQHQRNMLRITDDYARATSRLFGVDSEDVGFDYEFDDSDDVWDELFDFSLGDDFGKLAPDVQRAIDGIEERFGQDAATWADEAYASRTPRLAHPVIEKRTALSQGASVAEANERARNAARAEAYREGRRMEELAMRNRRWPRYQNGQAMLYRRQPEAGACGWCQIVSTRLYSMETFQRGASWHNNCRCDFRAVTEAEAVSYGNVLSKGGRSRYWNAAQALDMWSGEPPTNYAQFIKDVRSATPEG